MGTELDVGNLPRLLGIDDTNENYDNEQLYEALEKITLESDLDFSFGPAGVWDSDYLMVGIQYTNMRDDETLGEFKSRVMQQLQKHFEYLGQVNHIEAGWYDG
jgi:hypothetical protein